jgi:hypothetical protein
MITGFILAYMLEDLLLSLVLVLEISLSGLPDKKTANIQLKGPPFLVAHSQAFVQ